MFFPAIFFLIGKKVCILESPLATESIEFEGFVTVIPSTFSIIMSRPKSSAPPPVKIMPLSKISVNFSRKHQENQTYLERLDELMAQYDVPAKSLEIEITESAFSSNQQLLLSLIESLHGYGFLVSIDDFGSGYSSLNLIKELKFDVIKIDQVFFRNNGETERTKSVIQCIIQLAKELGMRTVAEGVETEAQFKFLKESKCDTIQGFYFSKPLEENIFTQLLASSDSADT